jgi:Glutamate-cysteine ligase family 2(GCS2)
MRGTMLACAGTHPVSDWPDAKMAPIQRYAELVEQMQWLARTIQTFGVHVHAGLRDGSKAIPVVNALATCLPHFLALTVPGLPRVGPAPGSPRAGRSSLAVADRRSAAPARGRE